LSIFHIHYLSAFGYECGCGCGGDERGIRGYDGFFFFRGFKAIIGTLKVDELLVLQVIVLVFTRVRHYINGGSGRASGTDSHRHHTDKRKVILHT
jgi:hypothetical protein